jgi:hypothetical protein
MAKGTPPSSCCVAMWRTVMAAGTFWEGVLFAGSLICGRVSWTRSDAITMRTGGRPTLLVCSDARAPTTAPPAKNTRPLFAHPGSHALRRRTRRTLRSRAASPALGRRRVTVFPSLAALEEPRRLVVYLQPAATQQPRHAHLPAPMAA